MNPVFMFFCGALFGILLYFIMTSFYIDIKEKERINNRHIYPLEQFMDNYQDSLIFSYRWADYVYFRYDMSNIENYLSVNIKNKTLSLFNKGEVVFTYSEDVEVRKLHKEYAEELISEYHNEIFVEVKKVNGLTMSADYIKNQYLIFKALSEIKEENVETENETEHEDLNIDDILEKIHKSGMESLTDNEKEFLKSVS